MNFLESTKLFLTFYHAIGLSPFHLATDKSVTKFAISSLSKYIQFVFCIALASFTIIRLNLNGQNGIREMETLLITVYMLFDILRGYFVFVQCVLYRQHFQEIADIFQRLDVLFFKYFGHVLTYQSFNKFHLLNIIKISIGYLFHFMVYVVIRQCMYGISPICFPIALLQLLQALNFLHKIFYIDALCFHLVELNEVIKKDNLEMRCNNCRPISAIAATRNRLIFYKKIHFALWEAGQVQNKVFGCCTIALVLRVFIDLVYSTFWLFDEINQNNEIIKVLRK